ncbi:GNAT family N-acetyltransferase [Streptomyces chumphonensis]|nr:GNAT family N-acetyltransferase [Streptomyces chumphonensis]
MVRVRTMRAADVGDVAAVRVRGWQVAYAGIVPQAHLDAMTVAADAARRAAAFAEADPRTTQLVADDGCGVVGWAAFGPYRGTAAGRRAGELYALYVRPDLVGTGVGRALLAAVHAATGDYDALLLWVLRDNRRARRFYEAAGYRADGAVQSETYGSVPVPEVRYARPAGPGATGSAPGDDLRHW